MRKHCEHRGLQNVDDHRFKLLLEQNHYYSIRTGALLLTLLRTETVMLTLPAPASVSGTRTVTCDIQLRFFTRPLPHMASQTHAAADPLPGLLRMADRLTRALDNDRESNSRVTISGEIVC